MTYYYPLRDERKTQSRAFLYIIEAYEWNYFMSRHHPYHKNTEPELIDTREAITMETNEDYIWKGGNTIVSTVTLASW